MENELNLLIQLQEHDAALDALQEKIASANVQIAAKTKEADALKASLKSAKDALTAAQMKKKQLEGEAESKEQLVKKHQGELNSLKSNDAYKAMLGEIEQAKQAVNKIEEDILAAMESVDAAEKDLKAKEQKVKAEEGAMKSAIAAMQAEADKIVADEKAKRALRDEFAITVPATLVARYNAIRKRGGLAIVALVNNTCSGCRMKLTANKVNEVVKAKAMIVCDSCSRILYVPKPAPQAAPAETTNTAS
jgi:predicted  nucleic acid-binding Zn-ribbon protein